MKINKQKHGKENTIGKIIYGFLMFMPLMAILTTCAYVIFNKNAYQSYSEQNDESIEYNVANELVNGERYYFNGVINTFSNTSGSQKVDSYYIENVEIAYTNYTWFNQQVKKIMLYLNNNTNNIILYAYDENNINLGSATLFNNYQINFYFNFISQANLENYSYFKNAFFEYTPSVETTKTLDNVFYYSIDKVQQSPLFSWATNTGTHNVLESTCQTLGITTPFVPMLLAYWLMMSLMYLLYDIALLIVHMAHNRIHDVESSI